jgi:hypothetical protein
VLLQSLNLAGIQSLRSAALAGLVPETAEQGPPQLRSLILNYTNVNDEAAPFISCCVSLQSLEVGGTKFTSKEIHLFNVCWSDVDIQVQDYSPLLTPALNWRNWISQVVVGST